MLIVIWLPLAAATMRQALFSGQSLLHIRGHKGSVHPFEMSLAGWDADIKRPRWKEMVTSSRLWLAEHALDDEDCDMLARAMHASTKLEILCLDHNEIGDAGATTISKALTVDTLSLIHI